MDSKSNKRRWLDSFLAWRRREQATPKEEYETFRRAVAQVEVSPELRDASFLRSTSSS